LIKKIKIKKMLDKIITVKNIHKTKTII